MGVRSYGDLIAPGRYVVHSRFDRAVNFISRGLLVSFVDAAIGAGPLNIVVDDPKSVVAQQVIFDGDQFEIGDQRIDLDSIERYDSRIDAIGNADPALFVDTVDKLKNALVETAPGKSAAFVFDNARIANFTTPVETAFVERFTQAIQMINAGKLVEGAGHIRGLGFGLTPSGDDFIAGVLFALNVKKMLKNTVQADIDGIYAAAATSNPFSRAFLRCARDGRAFERLKNVMSSLIAGDADSMRISLEKLLSIGETSGADMATGLVFGLEHMT